MEPARALWEFEKLPQGEIRQTAGMQLVSAIEPLVDRVRETDPTTAFSWAASINDENDRLNQLRQTLKSWRGSDLRGARTAFDAAELSDKERESLAKELE